MPDEGTRVPGKSFVLTEELQIERVDIWPVDVGLENDFVIAQGAVRVARNLFVEITLKGGARGYGEMAPFEAVSGETRSTSRVAAEDLARSLIGESVASYRRLSARLTEAALDQPAARCGLETAILDALARAAGIPLWALWGGHRTAPIKTDITIPISSVERSCRLARAWQEKGFDTLKIKVGADADQEIRLLEAIHRGHPQASYILDANEGFTESEALEFIEAVTGMGCGVILYEQPLNRTDLDGMARLKSRCRIPIAADEAVSSTADLREVLRAGAADVINLKIMKSGVLESLDIATLAATAGLGLMIGGMVETRLAMSCSLALAIGRGDIEFVDLDTPLLMSSDPWTGGYQYSGQVMLPWQTPGLGLSPSAKRDETTTAH